MPADDDRPLTVTVIGASPVILKGWQLLIEEAPDLTFKRAYSHGEATRSDAEFDVDAILIDCTVAPEQCLETIAHLREAKLELPVLAVSSLLPEETNWSIDAETLRRTGADELIVVARMAPDEALTQVRAFVARSRHGNGRSG